MNVDISWVVGFALLFCRATAMLLVAPLFANGTPVQIRVYMGALLAITTQAVHNPFKTMPDTVWTLAGWVGNEILVGLVIGLMIQWLLLAFQTAGAFLDLQLGMATFQMFNPALDSPTTILGQFKFTLAMVIFLMLNGHHQMLMAFWTSYEIAPRFSPDNWRQIAQVLIVYLSHLFGLAIQVAAPAAATTIIVDAAAGFVNKAIPQMQVYFLTAGLKNAVGIIAISVGLPVTVAAVRHASEYALPMILRALGGA